MLQKAVEPAAPQDARRRNRGCKAKGGGGMSQYNPKPQREASGGD